MLADERILDTRPPRLAYGAFAALALAAAVGSTIWAYIEYVTYARTSLLALALAITCFTVAATVLLAFRAAFTFHTVQAARPVPSPAEGPIQFGMRFRRGFIALIGGAASSVVAILLLPLRSLGGRPRAVLHATAWRRGVRVLTTEGAALRVTDVALGSSTPIVPEGRPDDPNSIAVLVRLRGSGQFRAYSRTCTHAGCAVCVFRAKESLLVCPCHHSTFDAAAGGRVVSGPASQPLPELPLAVTPDGFLVADGDFDRAVGPLLG
jgi:ubiquinol-cytochrome c reductase iron-sulfur subunit